MATKFILPCLPRLKRNPVKQKKAKDNECFKYRNELVEALDRSKGKLEASWKALDTIVSKPNYLRYAAQFYDILYTGGLLTEEGKLPIRGADLKMRSNYCVFKSHDELNALRVYEQLVKRLRQRHKHLDAAFLGHVERFLTLLDGFEAEARRRLTQLIALYLMDDQLRGQTLLRLGQRQVCIDEGVALEFMLLLCGTLKRERGGNFMMQLLQRSGLDHKIISFMPPMLRSDLNFRQVYLESDLDEIIQLQELRAGQQLRRRLQQRLLDDLREQLPHLQVVRNVRKFQRDQHMSDREIIGIVWQTINAGRGDSNVCSRDQLIRQLAIYSPLLNALCSTDSAQIALLMRPQEWCYDHHGHLKSFEPLAVQLYRQGVINQDAIVRWYEVDHIDKGKVAFLNQMRRFVLWLRGDKDASGRQDYNAYVSHSRIGRNTQLKVYSDMGPSLKHTK